MRTVLLLTLSNVFMTFAWYGHLKYGHDWALWKAILISWGIALLKYCLAVPANRLGYVEFSGFQLKIIKDQGRERPGGRLSHRPTLENTLSRAAAPIHP
jgi:uncharacterized protein